MPKPLLTADLRRDGSRNAPKASSVGCRHDGCPLAVEVGKYLSKGAVAPSVSMAAVSKAEGVAEVVAGKRARPLNHRDKGPLSSTYGLAP